MWRKSEDNKREVEMSIISLLVPIMELLLRHEALNNDQSIVV